MKEYNFYAFHPERFDPRVETLNTSEPIHWHIERIASHPPEENEALVVMGRALETWAQSQDTAAAHDEHAVELFSGDWHSGYKCESTRFFYLQMLPSIGLDSFYHHMIKTANKLGLIVFCDIDEGLYYPDGSSDPEFLYSKLKNYKDEVPIIVNHEINDILPLSKSKADVLLLLRSMIENVLYDLRVKNADVKIIGKSCQVTIDWCDAIIVLFPEVAVVNSNQDRSFYLRFAIQPKNIANDTMYKTIFIEPSDFIYHLEPALAGYLHDIEAYMTTQTLIDDQAKTTKIDRTEIEYMVINTEGDLYRCISRELNMIFSWLEGYTSLYDLYQEVYKDENHMLHNYYWEVPTSHVISQEYVFAKEGLLLLARYFHHPDLVNMLEQWLTYYVDTRNKAYSDGHDIEESEIFNSYMVHRLVYFCEELLKGYDPE